MGTWTGVRRSGLAGLGTVAAALVVFGSAGPAAAAHDSGPPSPVEAKGHWRFDATATTVTDVARVIGADRLWNAGLTGTGVGVALGSGASGSGSPIKTAMRFESGDHS